MQQDHEVEDSLRTYIEKIESIHNNIIYELSEELASKIEVLNDSKIKNDEIAKLKAELN